MESSSPTPGGHGHPAPFTIKQRRTTIACTHCRLRKKNLLCEYVTTTSDDQTSGSNTNNFNQSQPPSFSFSGPPNPATGSPSRRPPPAPLPYTPPPPPYHRPRYGAAGYPDLALSTADAQQGMRNHGYPGTMPMPAVASGRVICAPASRRLQPTLTIRPTHVPVYSPWPASTHSGTGLPIADTPDAADAIICARR
ncbi:hypothetical protein C8R46DRAFT_1349426 [Mycena filopes]|nr:hypothetical protein C8R46DRAFT_1349426 [Mycena filopes]